MMNLKEEINKAGSIVILGHVKPDGDCVGAATALYQYIKILRPELRIDMRLDIFDKGFERISCLDKINHEIDSTSYDVCFCVDCASRERLGRRVSYFENANHTIVIDHHVTNFSFGDIMEVDSEKSSTCEVLYDFLDKSLIDKAIATSLYIGLISDTGVFRYSCTSSSSHNMAAFLLDKKIEFTDIISEAYYEKSFKANKFAAQAVTKAKSIFDGKLVYTIVTKKMMKEADIDNTELEGIVEQLRNTRGCEIALFAYELDTKAYKLSMRSKHYIDVAQICKNFGGGGHIRAAGCTIRGNIKELFDDILKAIEKEI